MIMGPAPCPRKKLVGKFRWQVILKGRVRSSVRHLAELLIDQGITGKHAVRVSIDVDPVDLM
jgi:primosomal protein N' (replication factor Y)